MLVKTLMRTPVVTISEDGTVSEARALMRREGANDLVVTRGRKPVGVLGDRELGALTSRSDWQTPWGHLPIENVMTQSTLTIASHSHIREAIRLLCEQRADCVPVVQDDEVVGIITVCDVLALVPDLLEHRR